MNIRFIIGPNLLISCFLINGLLLASCATPSLRIQTDFIPQDSLRLAQVMSIADREDIVQAKPIHDSIIASGIPDSEIVDGSVVVVRIYCCGGITKRASSEMVNALMLYVPKGIGVGVGDIVEARSGNPPTKANPGQLNIVTRVVQKSDENDGDCWWDPKNDKLWLRILYCDWMPNEGWIKQDGVHPAWFKPAIPGASGN